MISIDEISRKWPLHWCVWNDNYQELQQLLKSEKVGKVLVRSVGWRGCLPKKFEFILLNFDENY